MSGLWVRTLDESSSDIISASSASFGTGDSDRASMYVPTNGGAFPGSQGVSGLDVRFAAGFWDWRGRAVVEVQDLCGYVSLEGSVVDEME